MTEQRLAALAGMTLITVCMLFAGCGQKGGLYLPEPAGEPVVSPETLPEPEAGNPMTFPEQIELPDEQEAGLPAPGDNPDTGDPAAEAVSD
jgi:predicted small lipoprotein YifL